MHSVAVLRPRLQHSMVWGWPKPNASNGGWTGYGNGKGRSGKAAGKWGEERPWQNRGGSKGAKVTKDTVPAFLKAWTAAEDKKMLAAASGAAVFAAELGSSRP